MKTFDVQAVDLGCPYDEAFRYISNPVRLPEWTHAFQSVSGEAAVMATPQGSMDVKLRVKSSEAHGTIDWYMEFPDRSVGKACSRLVDLDKNRCVYSFILMAPPARLEQVEGELDQQALALRQELGALQRILKTS